MKERKRVQLIILLLAFVVAAPSAWPQQDAVQEWNLHGQVTELPQGDPGFPAAYSGKNSLNSKGEIQETLSADLFVGAHLWRGGEIYADALLWQGYGLSRTEGIEDFPNGDAFKNGTTYPHFMFAHLFIRETIGLGGKKEEVADGPLSLAGERDISRLTLTIGRFTPMDMFDHNAYAQDAHSQFLNWAMQTNLAWDFPSDSVGYTTGIAAELNRPLWTLRTGFFQTPGSKNGFTADDLVLTFPHAGSSGKFFDSWGAAAEFERRCNAHARPGAVRFLGWVDEANMISYRQAATLLEADGPQADLSPARAYRHKYGFGLNVEQSVTKNVGIFSRLGWNNGQTEGWMYTDANWTASLGASVSGSAWHHPNHSAGLAFVTSGASASAQKFLEAGGLDIVDGDGALTYGSEKVTEVYYSVPVWENFYATPDFEFVLNPAFNRSRGPVPVLGVRFHWQF
ncbi:MAG TPA: carbohydrate porin [Candidatus Limnocylindrales bacterium]|nr:carbohydrate porin [Candidatus Limnocylindrales bacterium]